MAVDAFHVQIVAQGTEVTDLVLKLGMKQSSGLMAWVPLRPELWTNIVSDGDEIQLGSNAEDMAVYVPGPVVTFGSLNVRSGVYDYITMSLPRTCEVCGVRNGDGKCLD